MKWCVALILLLPFHFVRGQALTRKYVENWVAKFNPKAKGQPITLYVVNGQYFSLDISAKRDSVLRQLDSALHKLLCSDVAFIYGVSTDEVTFAEVPGKVAAMVVTKGKQSKKDKDQLLKKAIDKYDPTELYLRDDRNSKDPVLFINDKEVHFSQCRKELLKIKSSAIYAIAVYEQPVPPEYYGENAKNGLIEIWTYPAKK